MGKAAENERIKLKATFLNNIAVGLSVAGVLVPYLAFVQSGPQFHIIFDDFLVGNISQYRPLGLKAFAMIVALGSAALFRRGASREIAKIQD